MPDSFNGDLPAAISALIPIILIVSAVDADIATKFAARGLRNPAPLGLEGWRLGGPVLFAWWMLTWRFAALVDRASRAALAHQPWRLVGVDGLAAFPVVGLHVHLAREPSVQLREKRHLVDVPKPAVVEEDERARHDKQSSRCSVPRRVRPAVADVVVEENTNACIDGLRAAVAVLGPFAIVTVIAGRRLPTVERNNSPLAGPRSTPPSGPHPHRRRPDRAARPRRPRAASRRNEGTPSARRPTVQKRRPVISPSPVRYRRLDGARDPPDNRGPPVGPDPGTSGEVLGICADKSRRCRGSTA